MIQREARRLVVGGKVQGVGFRPFVYRLAHHYALLGSVVNHSGDVVIILEGEPENIACFTRDLLKFAPPLAEPVLKYSLLCERVGYTTFSILASITAADADVHLPPDYFMCDECSQELSNPTDRRYGYPFINCTHCGPRYTLISSLPYDRPSTSMATFTLCDVCAQEYENPLDRRFHAQPVACPDCGPQLWYDDGRQQIHDTDVALELALRDISQGKVVAVKGVGGYHLIADALNAQAVACLRLRKHRPKKPLAVMFPVEGENGLDSVLSHLDATPLHLELLAAANRPIVLIPQHNHSSSLAFNIASGMRDIGAILPYSPLHSLILTHIGHPLVVTSGNISGEPVITDENMAETRLFSIADSMLHHNRPILRPADDSVVQVIANAIAPIRLGRGFAPLEMSLTFTLEQPVVALGGQQKNTLCLGWGNRLVVFPHLGDMGTRRSLDVMRQLLVDIPHLYQVKPERWLIDHHPSYSYKHLLDKAPRVEKIWHHHAHASALAAEYPEVEHWCCFTWDGVGFGGDGMLWGGETFGGKPGEWLRLYSFRPFRLLGGDKAQSEPWRIAAALLWQSDMCCERELPQQAESLRQMWLRGINAPLTSAVGRLFDGVAWILGVVDTSSFEGQAPMLLQHLAEYFISSDNNIERFPESVVQAMCPPGNDCYKIDWQPLVNLMLNTEYSVGARAWLFHWVLAQVMVHIVTECRSQQPKLVVGLAGGVFQNRLLVELFADAAQTSQIEWRIGRQLPCNDGALSVGQVVEWAASQQRKVLSI